MQYNIIDYINTADFYWAWNEQNVQQYFWFSLAALFTNANL